jgi:hypothetical protein
VFTNAEVYCSVIIHIHIDFTCCGHFFNNIYYIILKIKLFLSIYFYTSQKYPHIRCPVCDSYSKCVLIRVRTNQQLVFMSSKGMEFDSNMYFVATYEHVYYI